MIHVNKHSVIKTFCIVWNYLICSFWVGSGEYGEYDDQYYDDYEEDDDEEESAGLTPIDELPKVPQTTTSVSPTVPSIKNSETTSVHPHRHHHGEVKKDENMPIWTVSVALNESKRN